VSYAYQPKYPKAKLREIVIKYLGVMRTLGHRPNCSVTFGAEGKASGASCARGWLLKDARPGSGGGRHVLLEDGDVWREVGPAVSLPGDTYGLSVWLNGPDDGLVTLLVRSQANARLNGDPFFEREEHVELIEHAVDDRRQVQEPFRGQERRTPR
jgi:hypothetical protein